MLNMAELLQFCVVIIRHKYQARWRFPHPTPPHHPPPPPTLAPTSTPHHPHPTTTPTRLNLGRAEMERDGIRAETRFGFPAKRTSPFISAGVSVQSTAGSRGVRISGQQLYRPCSDVQCKAAGYPLHSHPSPSLLHPCVSVCHHIPFLLY